MNIERAAKVGRDGHDSQDQEGTQQQGDDLGRVLVEEGDGVHQHHHDGGQGVAIQAAGVRRTCHGGQAQPGMGGANVEDRRVDLAMVGTGFREQFRKVIYRKKKAIPDGLVQRKIQEFTAKYPNLGRGQSGCVEGVGLTGIKQMFDGPADHPGTTKRII